MRREAERRGIDAGRLAAQIIQENLLPAERAAALRAMFSQWAAEDEADDPQELQRRQSEWEQLQRDMNANRATGRKLFINQPS